MRGDPPERIEVIDSRLESTPHARGSTPWRLTNLYTPQAGYGDLMYSEMHPIGSIRCGLRRMIKFMSSRGCMRYEQLRDRDIRRIGEVGVFE